MQANSSVPTWGKQSTAVVWWERAAGRFKGLSAEQDSAVQDRAPKKASLDYS